MDQNKSSKSTVETIVLPEVLDLCGAGPLTEKLLSARGRDLLIDGSHVQRVGAQCLQVLLSARKTWEADEVALDFINLSPDFVEGLANLGIPPAIFCPVTTASL